MVRIHDAENFVDALISWAVGPAFEKGEDWVKLLLEELASLAVSLKLWLDKAPKLVRAPKPADARWQQVLNALVSEQHLPDTEILPVVDSAFAHAPSY